MFTDIRRALSGNQSNRGALSAANPPHWGLLGLGSTSKSGRVINENSSLSITAYSAAKELIARNIGTIPWRTMREINGRKESAKTHDVHGLLKYRPHEDYTSTAFRKSLVHNAIDYGVGLAKIIRKEGKIIGFDLWHPSDCHRVTDESGITAWVNWKAKDVVLQKNMIVVLDLSTDARNPKRRLKIYADAFSLPLETRDLAINLYKKGLFSSGWLSTDGKIPEEAKPGLIKSITAGIKGAADGGGIGLLEHGLEFAPGTTPLQNAQFIETQQMLVEDVCRIVGVHPRHIGVTGSGTKSNSEQHDMELVRNVLRPWVVQIDQEFTYKCFGVSSEYYTKLDLSGLLEGDFAQQTERYKMLISSGLMDIDGILALMDKNPLPDGLGKTRPIPINTIDITEYAAYSEKIASKKENV